MDTNERHDTNSKESEDRQKPESDKSPGEKLDKTARSFTAVPGAENPDSEIKEEKGPNTE